MLISNIISKLPAIIYKLGIIYKATTTPTNKNQNHARTTINTGSIEPLYTTCLHTQHTATSLCLSLFRSYELHYNIYLLYSLYTNSYSSIEVLCFSGPPLCQRHLSKPTCEVQDLTQPRPPWRVTVTDFGKNIWRPPWGHSKTYPTTPFIDSYPHLTAMTTSIFI